jgi:very-short-patch-repair endonuclease
MRGPQPARTNPARILRKTENDAEGMLWSALRNHRLNGHKFVRQVPIGRFFADFACRPTRLVVEVDGSQHAESVADGARDTFMVAEGWSVLRFWNTDVLRRRDEVLETILAALEYRLDSDVIATDLRFIASADYREKMR